MFKNKLLSILIINQYFLFKFVKFLNKDKFLIFVQLYIQNIKIKNKNLFLLVFYIFCRHVYFSLGCIH